MYAPIGVFDSGYGGLTILKDIRAKLPQYDYLYLGDNARAPYGTRSFDVVYRFTLQAVEYLFKQGCPLVILACNTASAKALRSIQQKDLQRLGPDKRVLGIIRPTAEALNGITATGHVGIMATPGTIQSKSYDIEIAKLFPNYVTTGHACPMWVSLVEYGKSQSDGADFFIREDMNQLLQADPKIDTVLLACTHYPILYHKIRRATPEDVNLIRQGNIVAASLEDYLHRHPDMEQRLTRSATCRYLTTETAEKFTANATTFLDTPIQATTVTL